MDACTVVLARVTGVFQGRLPQREDKTIMDFSGLVSTPAKAPNLPETVADHSADNTARPKEPAQVAGFFVSMI